MLLDFARKTYSQTIALFLVALLFLWLKQILLGEISPIEYDEMAMPLASLLSSFITSPLWESVCVIVVSLISAVVLMVVVLRHEILRERDYLAAFIFILLSLALPSLRQVSGAHIAVFFCLLSLNRLLSIYNKTGKSGNIYLATLYVGVAGLFYPPALLFLPIFLMGIALLKVFNWRDLFLSIFGTVTPFIFAASYYHLFDKDLQQPINTIISYFTPGTPFFTKEFQIPDFNIGYLYAGYIIFLIIIATISNVRGISANIKTSRVLGILRLSIGVLLIAIVVFPAMQSSFMLIVISLPASILITSYLSGIRRVKVANILLILLVASCILLQFYF